MVAHTKDVARLIAAIEAVREIETHKEIIPLQELHTLLVIAMKPGQSHRDIGKATGLGQSSVNRYVHALGMDPAKGHQLVETIPDPVEPRRGICFLTEKGKQRMARIVGALTNVHVSEFDAPTARQWQSGSTRFALR